MLISRVTKDDKPAVKCLTNKMRVLLVVILTTLSLVATAQERVALVIGNSNYITSPLANTLNDAQDIAETLKELDFTVTTVIDGDRKEMIKAIRAFGKSLDKKTIALFYYAGHGVQYNGENYLIPVGALPEITERSYLEDEAVTLSRVTRVISESGSKLNFVFLDACRNNPIPADSRGIQKGLIVRGTEGMITSYATEAGEVSEDGEKIEGGNSPYTSALLELIIKPNVPIETMLKDLRSTVRIATSGRQKPEYRSGIEGEFCFKVEGEGCGINIIIQNTIVGIPSLEGVDNIQLVELEDGSTYVGQIIGSNTPQGKGVMTLTNGDQLEGEWHSGDISKGKITTADGAHYEGEIQNRQMHGQGIKISFDGSRYEGEFRWSGFIQGQVVHNYSENRRYEGEWKDGQRNGQGIMSYNDGRRYSGRFEKNFPSGQGVMTWANGKQYEGEWKNNNEHGKGKVTWADGTSYEGEWRHGWIDGHGVTTWINGLMAEGNYKILNPTREDSILDSRVHALRLNGKLISQKEVFFGVLDGHGEYKFSNGAYYGQITNGTRHGKGIFVYSDGSRYEGDWERDTATGRGVWVYSDGSRYEGEWVRGVMINGHGIKIYSDGSRYEGEWERDTATGQGVKTYANGTRYEGEFKDDEYHGQGIVTYPNGTRYEGEFKYDKYHQGIVTYPNGNRYEGEFKDDKYHGQGVFTSVKFSYEGEWKDGHRNGQGVSTCVDGVFVEYGGRCEIDALHNGQVIYIFLDGSRYEGEWKDGQRNGQGIYTHPDGGRYEGEWKDGQRNGQGVYTNQDGDLRDGVWAEDIMITGQIITTLPQDGLQNDHVYETQLKDGVLHGPSVRFFLEGMHCVIEFKDGVLSGKGVLTWPTGRSYKGELVHCTPNGQGLYTYPKGVFYEGEWEDNEYSGQGIYVWSTGQQFEGELKNGVPDGWGVETCPLLVTNSYSLYCHFRVTGKVRIRHEGEYKDGKIHGQGIYTHSDGSRYEGEFRDDIHGDGVFQYTDLEGHTYEITTSFPSGSGIWFGGYEPLTLTKRLITE